MHSRGYFREAIGDGTAVCADPGLGLAAPARACLLYTSPDEMRLNSVRFKSGKAFLQELRKCAESFATFGPNFANVWLDGKPLIRREELRRMYKAVSYTHLSYSMPPTSPPSTV